MTRHIIILSAFLALLSVCTAVASEIRYSDIESRSFEYHYPGTHSNNWYYFVYSAHDDTFYHCVGTVLDPGISTMCAKTMQFEESNVPQKIVDIWKRETKGEVVGWNIGWDHEFLDIPGPYRQSVYTRFLFDKIKKKIWACRYVLNEFEFSSAIDDRDVYLRWSHLVGQSDGVAKVYSAA